MAYRPGLVSIFFSCLILASCLLFPCLSFGAVEGVTLYPRGALVQESVELEKKRSRVDLVLPGEARRDTLRVRPSQGRVQSVSLTREKRRSSSEEIRELKKRIQELERKKAEAENDLQRVGKLIAFYEGKVSAETKGAKETKELADLLDSSLEGLYQKRLSNREKQSEIKSELREAKKRLEELTGREEAVWRARVEMEKAMSRGGSVKYSYYLDSASWSPEYTLNALPEEDRVDLVWRAKVKQSSGSDWRGVDLRVATASRSFRPDPPQVREWVIGPSGAGKKADRKKVLSARAEQGEAASAPQRERSFATDVYKLGRTDLPAGDKRRLVLRRIGFEAGFLHLLRPLETPECFIRAKLNSTERMRLPEGKASLELQGTYIGNSSFSMRGKEATVFFGADRDVDAEVELLTKMGGEQGFIRNKKTYQWGWRFRIANTRDQAIGLRLELPWPRLRSEKIELEPLHDFSKEDVREHRAIKELDVAASDNATVQYGIRIVYPEDMELDFGRF